MEPAEFILTMLELGARLRVIRAPFILDASHKPRSSGIARLDAIPSPREPKL
ncbi:MAG: hypothetical protein QXW83_02275 [Nitrososphaerales archaeon]